jgi:hypothetical protein
MSFEFLQELSEARLFRNPSRMKEMYTGELADNFFNAVLSLEILKKTQPQVAQRYAKQTLQSGSIDGWRSSGSDLHNMAFMLKEQDRYEGRLTKDRHVTLPYLQFMGWLRNMAQGRDDKTFDRQFLLKLQTGLGVESAALRSARRIVADWDHSLTDEHKIAATRVFRGLRHDLQASDMYVPYAKAMNKKGLLISDEPEKRGILPSLAKTAALAVGGYYLGKKMAKQ